MFIRASTLVLAVVAGVLAIPGTSIARTTASQCDTGSLQCCDSTTPGGDAGLFGFDFPITGLIGFGCTPITDIGNGSGTTCYQETMCCSGFVENGLIYLGCSPVNLNL